MKNNVLIIGAGVLGSQFNHFINHFSENRVIGWLDDTKEINSLIEGKKILGGISDISAINGYDSVGLAIGYNHLLFKNQLIQRLIKKSIPIFSFTHPSSFVDFSAKIGEGTFIYPNATIDQKVTIGYGCIVNNNVVISHNSKIGTSSFIAPSVTITGNVNIGENCFIGAGSIINDSVSICDNTVLGSGSLVVDDILEPGKYVGGPKLRKI